MPGNRCVVKIYKKILLDDPPSFLAPQFHVENIGVVVKIIRILQSCFPSAGFLVMIPQNARATVIAARDP